MDKNKKKFCTHFLVRSFGQTESTNTEIMYFCYFFYRVSGGARETLVKTTRERRLNF